MKIKETLESLLPGVEISEEFVSKLSTSIELAVAQRVEEETKEIKEAEEKSRIALIQESLASQNTLNEQIKEITDKANAYADYVVKEMTKKVEDYCEYVIEKFVADQKERLVESADYARMKKALNTIKSVFETNFFQLSDEPATKTLEKELKEQKEEFNELFEEHRTLKRQVERENRKSVFESITGNLADTQKERLSRLIEKSNFQDMACFEEGVKLMVEELNQGKPSTETKPTSLNENKTIEKPSAETLDNDFQEHMKKYLERL